MDTRRREREKNKTRISTKRTIICTKAKQTERTLLGMRVANRAIYGHKNPALPDGIRKGVRIGCTNCGDRARQRGNHAGLLDTAARSRGWEVRTSSSSAVDREASGRGLATKPSGLIHVVEEISVGKPESSQWEGKKRHVEEEDCVPVGKVKANHRSR